MATRLYFPVTTAAPVTVAFASDWQYTSEAISRMLADVKGSSAITVGTQIGPWTAGNLALDRQYISTRMNAGIVFSAGVTSMNMQLMVREYNNGDNTSYLIFSVRVVSEDGSTVRAILDVPFKQSANEFINNATHRNQALSQISVCNNDYTTVLGDRLVVEIGYSDNSGSTPEASAKWGENATDLPGGSAQTTDGAGWVEFSNTITFAGEVANPIGKSKIYNQAVKRSSLY